MIKEASLFFIGRLLQTSGSREVLIRLCSFHIWWLIVPVVGASTADHRSKGDGRPIFEGYRKSPW